MSIADMPPEYSKKILVNRDNGKCAGHFEGTPIVPAAVMLGWLMQFLSEQTGQPLGSFEARGLKCVKELHPGSVARLELMPSGTRWQGSIYDEFSVCLNVYFCVTHECA